MKVNPQIAMMSVLVLGGGYVLYRVAQAVADAKKSVDRGIDKTIDTADQLLRLSPFNRFIFYLRDRVLYGPEIELQNNDAGVDYYERGYIERLPNGRTRITAEGQAYIDQQRRLSQ